MDSAGLFVNRTWLEQYFSTMEKFCADGDDVSVRWCNHLDLIVDVASAVKSFVMFIKISWNKS